MVALNTSPENGASVSESLLLAKYTAIFNLWDTLIGQFNSDVNSLQYKWVMTTKSGRFCFEKIFMIGSSSVLVTIDKGNNSIKVRKLSDLRDLIHYSIENDRLIEKTNSRRNWNHLHILDQIALDLLDRLDR